MVQWKPDPTFYPSPRMAMQAPAETLAYVAVFNPNKNGKPDAMTIVDLAPNSSTYGTMVGKVDMPNAGDELHHFGWNACSSASVHMRRIHTLNVGIWLCPGFVHRESTSLIPNPIQNNLRS